MCGIVGYTGTENAVPKILKGLTVLEYRGYDSVGLAGTLNGEIKLSKCKGRVEGLKETIKTQGFPELFCAIGHTRWATHGGPSYKNAHPHKTDVLALVHNGIIENYRELKEELLKEGETFLSQTDTEVAAVIISREYKKFKCPKKAIYEAVAKLKGSYAFEVIFNDLEGEIFAIREASPLILGEGKDGSYIASDMMALLPFTKNLHFLNEGELAHATQNSIKIIKQDFSEYIPKFKESEYSANAVEKGEFEHFMLKEMYEQPKAFSNTVETRVTADGLPTFDSEGLTDSILKNIQKVSIVACGSAMHAGLVGKQFIERYSKVPTSVEIASEFRYNGPLINSKTLVIIVSQSGETADSIAALEYSKQKGAFVLGIVNALGSTIARKADATLYTFAGSEIAVATTKGYLTQVAALMLFAIKLGLVKNTLEENSVKIMCELLKFKAPKAIEKALMLEGQIKEVAKKFYNTSNLFYIGRGLDYSLALEGSLKLKEISYIHSEAYAAGELKHGTISLIEEGTPVFALSTDNTLYDKTVSNIKECASRGAKVLFICFNGADSPENVADTVIKLPEVPSLLAPLCAVVVMQLLAYHIAKLRGCDIDKPRNLAKSVTVE